MESPFKLVLNASFLAARKLKRERSTGILRFAQFKLVGSRSIKVYKQYFRGFTFYLEQTTFYVRSPVVLTVMVKNPCLIFLYIIEGEIHCATSDQSGHSKRLYFSHLIPAGVYSWKIQRGKIKVLFFTMKPEWLLKMGSEFPELVKIVEKIMQGDIPNKVFPHYNMSVKTLNLLKRLMSYKVKSRIQLESELLNTINKLVKEYQTPLTTQIHVPKSNRQVAYEVRDHIIDMVTKGIIPYVSDISNTFNIEPKTLRRRCFQAFNMNVQELITDAQMKSAYGMLKKGMLVKVIAFELGYADTAIFSRRFKKYFGYNPSELFTGRKS